MPASAPEQTPPSGNLSSSTIDLEYEYTLDPSPPLDETHDTTVGPGIPQFPMNISSSSVSHQSSPEVALQLGHTQLSSPLEPSHSLDDDDILPSDLSALRPAGAYITCYPGYQYFHVWLESQFPTIIPNGTASFLHQFHLDSEEAVHLFSGHNGVWFCDLIGAHQYDRVRLILAEIRTILDYVTKHPKDDYYSYTDFLDFRSRMKPFYLVSYPESRHLLDPGSLCHLVVPPHHPPRAGIPENSTPYVWRQHPSRCTPYTCT